ncbi:hypothetical protein AFM12_11670 [Jiulongibacter sediminis]|uniref:SGNH hydrolase-type esterase domain-containing protein n=2 Tax=Jiulongibacter sediminis TaxID=1605367 RepID=A0A0P7C3Z6_9BACT|nr:hypothetical protein AFM12_11670 [Jiulongibacter sediminis]TBX24071.1 hypothetical protein TK44_11680 [Jiulongibacter sediminis]
MKVLTKAIDNGRLDKDVIRKTTLRVLDLVEGGIYKSAAGEGKIGSLNRYTNAVRQKSYWKYFREVSSSKNKQKDLKRVVAEGDSWFNHPFLCDILEVLNLENNVSVYSMAYAADWLQNYIYGGEYIEGLSLIKPDAFLVSGGGNDLLEGQKLGLFIRQPSYSKSIQCTTDYPDDSDYYLKILSHFPTNDSELVRGYKYLNKAFISQVKLMIWSYYFMFHNIRKKYKTLLIITQGYSEAIPAMAAKNLWFSLNYFYKGLLNRLQNNGNWIENPLRNSQIYDVKDMRCVLKAMIHIFNESLISLAKDGGFDNLVHVDNRGLATSNDWFDEMHMKSYRNYQIAKVYSAIIKGDLPPISSYRTTELFSSGALKADTFIQFFGRMTTTKNFMNYIKWSLGLFFVVLILLIFCLGIKWQNSFFVFVPLGIELLRRFILSSYILWNLKN